MGSFARDYDWQLKFLPEIQKIVGPLLLQPADFKRDATEATDMLVLMARDMRIGCRVRRAGYADRYPWEFTIRSKRDSGADTELKKIIDGWGDWIFYGHAHQDDCSTFTRYFVIDLRAFRAQLIRSKGVAGSPKTQSNGDGTHFVAFDVRRFQPEPRVCIASSHEIPLGVAA